jgi:hypothetical protein
MTNYMIVKQRVADFGRFQAAFDELRPERERYGLRDVGQYRSADEADTVIVVMEVADVARAGSTGTPMCWPRAAGRPGPWGRSVPGSIRCGSPTARSGTLWAGRRGPGHST